MNCILINELLLVVKEFLVCSWTLLFVCVCVFCCVFMGLAA